jgi:glycosyltransferase involved in cell wall biosynthesis
MRTTESVTKASIIIPTYNRADYLDLTLQSIKNQETGLFDMETIVVDDGSTDHTFEICRKYQKLIDIKYFFQEDLGNRTAQARNLGITNAKGEIIIFIDSGIILNSTCIYDHIITHSKSSEEAAVIGYVYGFDQYCPNIEDLKSYVNVDNIDGSINKLKELGMFKDMRERLYMKADSQINEMPAPWVIFITCNCSIRKSTLERVGYFDTNLDFNWGVEDLELGYRLWKHNVKFIVDANAMSIHYPHDADMKQKFEEEKINKDYFHKKHNSLATKVFLNCSFLEINEKIHNNNLTFSHENRDIGI